MKHILMKTNKIIPLNGNNSSATIFNNNFTFEDFDFAELTITIKHAKNDL